LHVLLINTPVSIINREICEKKKKEEEEEEEEEEEGKNNVLLEDFVNYAIVFTHASLHR